MQELKKVGVLSLAKISGAIGLVYGLIIGIIFAIVSGLVFSGLGEFAGADVPGFGLFFGVLGIVVVPILYAIIGFIGGLIAGVLYNLIAGWIGGIEVELA